MTQGAGRVGDEVSKVVDIQGLRLEIIAHRVSDTRWSLCVVNELGIQSHWTEFFHTAKVAIETAEKAIENERVEAFVDSEGFEYLLH